MSKVSKLAKAPKSARQEILPLADFLCFATYSANLTFGKAYKPMLDELGLTYTQYITIIALWEERGQTVSGLGEKLFLESNTLTPILKKLEGMGYVTRQRDAADERQVRVDLTDEGRALRERAFAVGLFEACGLSQEEFTIARDLLIKLRTSLFNSLHK
ncbi:MarR family winged helix-turn-helix transcriptional regulator [Undibacterium terreum]|uniref:MarR family transcriptional regulator n=1 Tax=Undibacterium terreum TaxID=1224302 RepID=A0A916V1Y5_9BURK|nr:MarR family transcriptional regulator [Undibacterium terreum]GGC97914.1 MarR family transcriptional regulator [Undibacterium terreum]